MTQSATGLTWSVNVRKVHHVQKSRIWKSVVRGCALIHKCDKVDLQVQSQTDTFFLKKKHLSVKKIYFKCRVFAAKGWRIYCL